MADQVGSPGSADRPTSDVHHDSGTAGDVAEPLSKTSLREEIILEEPDSRDSASFDMELDDLDPRVVEALLSLNRAIESVTEIEFELDEVKGHYREVIREGDDKLRVVAARMGMQKAVERSQAYYISQQNAHGAQEDAKIVALQYEKATNTFSKAQQEQVDIERRMREELSRSADTVGAMQLSPELQEELNHAAMRIDECRTYMMDVAEQHRQATERVNQARAKVEALLEERRPYIEKAQIYFDAKDEVEQEIIRTQKKLDKLVDDATRSRQHLSDALQYLVDLSVELRDRQESGAESDATLPVKARKPRTPSPIMKRFRILTERRRTDAQHGILSSPDLSDDDAEGYEIVLDGLPHEGEGEDEGEVEESASSPSPHSPPAPAPVLSAPAKAVHVQGASSLPAMAPLKDPRVQRPKSASVLQATRSDTSFTGGVSKYAASILGADSDDDEVTEANLAVKLECPASPDIREIGAFYSKVPHAARSSS